MDSYNKLKTLIKNKTKERTELNKKQQDLVDLITGNKEKIENINDFAIDYKEIKKNGFNFCLLTYKSSIPIKKERPTNKLDYDMKDFYILKLYINKDDDLIEIILNKSEKKKDISLLYLDYLDKINLLKTNELFECLIDTL